MNISTKALLVISLVKNAISKSITGVSFFSIKDYSNSNGEVSNQLINVGINYEKSKQKDIEFLRNMKFADFEFKSSIAMLKQAKNDLINAFIKPSENRSNGQIDAFTTIFSGVKVHNETGKLYIYGYRQSKQVLLEGVYPIVKSSELTIAKNELRKLLKTGKFVQFSIEVGNTLKANGETIEL